MSRSYTRPFAEYYDIRAENMFLNVDHELDFFKFVFDNFARIPVHHILDVGCGTGRHYIPLMQDGYDVTGVDLSQNMLNVLRKKAKAAKLKPHVLRKDMRDIDFSGEFDAIVCMNSAFQYLMTDEEILHTLKAFRGALKPGGVAITDIFNFLSLLGRYRENIIEHQSKNGLTFKWAIRHSVEDLPCIWNHEEFGIIEDGGETMTYKELHRFRMLNYNEMRRFLSESGFQEIRCFGEFTAREEAKSNAKRLIFVATA